MTKKPVKFHDDWINGSRDNVFQNLGRKFLKSDEIREQKQ